MSSHSCELTFERRLRRTSSTRISPPPPGNESSPASWSARRISRAESPVLNAEDLGRREAVEMDAVARLELAQERRVPVEVEIGMQPALHQNAAAAELEGLLDLAVDLVIAQHVSPALTGRSVKRAEVADRRADVRIVDVAIDNEGHRVVRMALGTHAVGERDELVVADPEERHRRVERAELDRLGLAGTLGKQVEPLLELEPAVRQGRGQLSDTFILDRTIGRRGHGSLGTRGFRGRKKGRRTRHRHLISGRSSVFSTGAARKAYQKP